MHILNSLNKYTLKSIERCIAFQKSTNMYIVAINSVSLLCDLCDDYANCLLDFDCLIN